MIRWTNRFLRTFPFLGGLKSVANSAILVRVLMNYQVLTHFPL